MASAPCSIAHGRARPTPPTNPALRTVVGVAAGEGYALAAGFPAGLAPVFRRRALARGLAVVEVRERAGPFGPGRPRRREVAEVALPAA